MLLFSLNLWMVGFAEEPRIVIQDDLNEQDEQELVQLVSIFLQGDFK